MKNNPKAQYLWIQEEPVNMGAWSFVQNLFRKDDLDVIARQPASSPATGFKKVHDKQQADIIQAAFRF